MLSNLKISEENNLKTRRHSQFLFLFSLSYSNFRNLNIFRPRSSRKLPSAHFNSHLWLVSLAAVYFHSASHPTDLHARAVLRISYQKGRFRDFVFHPWKNDQVDLFEFLSEVLNRKFGVFKIIIKVRVSYVFREGLFKNMIFQEIDSLGYGFDGYSFSDFCEEDGKFLKRRGPRTTIKQNQAIFSDSFFFF